MKANISLGTDSSGKAVLLDLEAEKIRNIIVSGPTGSGKSTFHHDVCKQLMAQNTPEEVGFLFFDLKRIEYGGYARSEYLAAPIIYDLEQAIATLESLAGIGPNLELVRSAEGKTLVVHIEECDLVLAYPARFEAAWMRLAQEQEQPGVYVLYSSSRCTTDVFSPSMIRASDMRIVCIPGGPWATPFDPDGYRQYSSALLTKAYTGKLEQWQRIVQIHEQDPFGVLPNHQ